MYNAAVSLSYLFQAVREKSRLGRRRKEGHHRSKWMADGTAGQEENWVRALARAFTRMTKNNKKKKHKNENVPLDFWPLANVDSDVTEKVSVFFSFTLTLKQRLEYYNCFEHLFAVLLHNSLASRSQSLSIWMELIALLAIVVSVLFSVFK